MEQFAERLKKLRTDNQITQESLAKDLGVSYQAVSKWETSQNYPDITLLPAIANYFGVSADYLLGIELDRRQDRIDAYFDKAINYNHTGELEKSVEMLRAALKEYPNNCRLLFKLCEALFGISCASGEVSLLNEVVDKSERLLHDCTDDDIRLNTLEILTYSYNILGKQDMAVATANRIPASLCNRNQVLSNIIIPMEARKKAKQECIFANFEIMIVAILWLGGLHIGSKEYEKALEIYQRAEILIRQVGDEGFFLLRLADAHAGLSMAYSGLSETDTAFEYIEKAMETYRKYRELLKQDGVPYTSPIFDKLIFSVDNIYCNSQTSDYEGWYQKLRETYDCYASVRKDSRFQAICRRIERDIARLCQ